MKTIALIALCVTVSACADEAWMHPQHAAYSPPERPNLAQKHEDNYQRALDRALEDQEAFDSVEFSERK